MKLIFNKSLLISPKKGKIMALNKQKTSLGTSGSKRKKYILFLIAGITLVMAAQYFSIRQPDVYTNAALALTTVIKIISYSTILGIISLVVAAIRRKVKKLWLPIFAWLFLIAGIFDVTIGSYNKFGGCTR